MLPFVSAICLQYGDVDQLNDSLACFLAQDYQGEHEIVILNSFEKQKLRFEHPRVRIINLGVRPPSLAHCRNLAIQHARGDVMVTFDSDDAYLPFYLSTFGRNFLNGEDWCWLQRQFFMERWQIRKITPAGINTLAFTKAAWQKIGGYKEGLDVGEDREFAQRLTTQATGRKVDLQPSEIGLLYAWGEGNYHVSGQGVSKSAYRRVATDLAARVMRKQIPVGEIQLQPKLKYDYSAMAAAFVNRIAPAPEPIKPIGGTVVIQLGKMGDILNCLPICHHLWRESGEMPAMLVAREFASVLDGASYVRPHILDTPWDNLTAAMDVAKANYQRVVRAQIYGRGHSQPRLTESYSKDSWREAGFLEYFHDKDWPLVFDRRDKAREDMLRRKLFLTAKPKIVTNLTNAQTAPFARGIAVLQTLRKQFPGYEVVDIGKLKLHRIYDLLGIIEQAKVFVSIDTATLHLAAATQVPVVALVSDAPWGASVVRFNCADTIQYRNATPQAVADSVRAALAGATHVHVESVLARPLATNGNRIALPSVTLWACCWSDDRQHQLKTLRVLRYCSGLFDFGRVLLFSYLPVPPVGFKLDTLQIPKLTMPGWNVFHNRIVPLAIDTAYALSVHEDGFVLEPKLWKDEFLSYDYCGAPWPDGVVGNGGFALESQKLLKAKLALPFDPAGLASDYFICRLHKATLEKQGIRFAPQELALEFSTELTGKAWPSFGWHGRTADPVKYKKGWQLIAASENDNAHCFSLLLPTRRPEDIRAICPPMGRDLQTVPAGNPA